MRFVVVTGISGAGKSQTLKCLEEMGYYCVDNLPPLLIPKFIELCTDNNDIENVAIVIDIRSREMFIDINDVLNNLNFKYEILFLEADDSAIIKRYKETRRLHPLSNSGTIFEGLTRERELLKDLREKSDYIIDTTNLTNSLLKSEISNIFLKGNDFKGIILNVLSFGFKYGIPPEADLMFDVRFLPNPYYLDSLKLLTGLTEEVQEFVCKYKQTQIFIDKLNDMVDFLIPYYKAEGKTQLVIAIGCTGGKHRSVTVVEKLQSELKLKGYSVVVNHRDIYKDGNR